MSYTNVRTYKTKFRNILLYSCTLGYEGWGITFPNGVTYTDQVMAQAVKRWLLTAGDQTISWAVHVEFVVDKMTLGQTLRVLDFPCQYNSTNAPHSHFIHLPSMIYGFINLQCHSIKDSFPLYCHLHLVETTFAIKDLVTE